MQLNKVIGSSLAAETLEKELEKLNDERVAAKLIRLFANFNRHMNDLEHTSSYTKHRCAPMLYHEFKEYIIDQWEWPGNIRELAQNVLHSYFKKHIAFNIEYSEHSSFLKFGTCVLCKNKATIRYKEHNCVITKCCVLHSNHISTISNYPVSQQLQIAQQQIKNQMENCKENVRS